jgi:hypothetical protein
MNHLSKLESKEGGKREEGKKGRKGRKEGGG